MLTLSLTVCIWKCVCPLLCELSVLEGLITRCHRDELGCCSVIHPLLFAVCFKVQSLLVEFVASAVILCRFSKPFWTTVKHFLRQPIVRFKKVLLSLKTFVWKLENYEKFFFNLFPNFYEYIALWVILDWSKKGNVHSVHIVVVLFHHGNLWNYRESHLSGYFARWVCGETGLNQTFLFSVMLPSPQDLIHLGNAQLLPHSQLRMRNSDKRDVYRSSSLQYDSCPGTSLWNNTTQQHVDMIYWARCSANSYCSQKMDQVSKKDIGKYDYLIKLIT